jgi:hypothetical protein
MKNINELLEKLKTLSSSGEGNLILYPGTEQDKESQVSFLQKYLKKINPSVVLETGTNFGCFSILVKETLPNTKVITFGIDEWSKSAIDTIHEHYDNEFIKFIHGDSVQTFTSYETSSDIDMAWIDGGHQYGVCMSDLINCDRLKIENIFVDDYSLLGDVTRAVNEFCDNDNTPYSLIETSEDARSIAYIKRNE